MISRKVIQREHVQTEKLGGTPRHAGQAWRGGAFSIPSQPPFFATIARNTFRELAEVDVGPINTCAQRPLAAIAQPNCSLIVH